MRILTGAAMMAAGVLVLSQLAGTPHPLQAGEMENNRMEENKSLEDSTMEKAIFAAGCFWGVEAAFRETDGVTATRVGYTGGHAETPTYRQVCSDNTGHAEAVEVTFDPTRVSFGELLSVFWNAHDPTQVNRQGPDIGSQYRSAVFYLSDTQKSAALESKKELEASGQFKRPIATEISAATAFWEAEEYHQQYLEKRGLSSCRIK